MSTKKVQEGQSVFDIVLQGFGTLENIGNFLVDNPSVSINDEPFSGQEVEINSTDLGDNDVKTKFIKTNFVTNNKDGNFEAPAQEPKQFQNGDAFEFQNGDAFYYN
jgi:hypothetical protein